MKKIINGKLYNTETAQPIAEYTSEEGPSDFRYYHETLYQKRSGEFFLAGEGGAMTRYAVSHGNSSYSGGSGIFPITADDAREWLEHCSDVETYEKVFGEVAEDDSRVSVNLSLTREAAELLKRLSQDTGESRSAIVDRLVKAEAAGAKS